MCKLSTFIWCCDDVILILVWGILFVDVSEFCEVCEDCEDCGTNVYFSENS